jgi:hypothetical protein
MENEPANGRLVFLAVRFEVFLCCADLAKTEKSLGNWRAISCNPDRYLL